MMKIWSGCFFSGTQCTLGANFFLYVCQKLWKLVDIHQSYECRRRETIFETQYSCSAITVRSEFVYCCSLEGRVHQYRILPDANGLLAVQVGGQLHCSEKKHPLTFSVISPWKMFRFTQNVQGMFMRNQSF